MEPGKKWGAFEPSYNVPGSDAYWEKNTLARAVNVYETFKNHVSILFWSLGNESYVGDVLEKMNALRIACDEAELLTAKKYWPFPTYSDLLFGVK